MSHAENRRQMVRSRGRVMILRRLAGLGEPQRQLTLLGFPRLYRPGEIEGAIQQGDQQVEILADEMERHAQPWEPRQGNVLVMDGHMTTLQGANRVHEGARIIGWTLWVRG